MQEQKKIYFENLDGLRWICFLMVFLYHSFFSTFPEILNAPAYHFIKKDLFGNGNLGVNFFFVLSGFLITYLLIEEKKTHKKIHIPNFWIRRILRIWPLFYFCVFFGFVVFPLLKSFLGQPGTETAHLLSYLTFTNNFDLLKNGLPDASVLGVLWSVAIEEQFYFIWPLILSVFPVKKYWIPFLLLIAGSFIFRACYNTDMMHEYHTLSCMGDLTIGAMGAWLYLVSSRFKTWIIQLPRVLIAGLYIGFIAVFFFRDDLVYAFPFVRVFERSIIAVLMLLIILEQCFGERSWFKISRFKTMSKLGTITYGLYCLHFIGILIAVKLTALLGVNKHLWQVVVVETLLSLTFSIIISMVSYRFFETPFLRLKKRFSFITRE